MWARAADRPDEALRAAVHLRASELEPTRLLELKAWLAAQSGNRPTEQAALEEIVKIDPGAATALERLAELAALEGKRERVTELRAQKGRTRYRQGALPRTDQFARSCAAIC